MFYKQLVEITNVLNKDFVVDFDYWLGTLPSSKASNISASTVANLFDVSYSQSEAILKFCEKKEILRGYYLIKCPNCNFTINQVEKDEVADVLMSLHYCNSCEVEVEISPSDIFISYQLIKKPDLSETEIAKIINEKFEKCEIDNGNFSNADSLSSIDNSDKLYDFFYNPSESAYDEFKKRRNTIDMDYGNNTTAKGDSLEKLILSIFNQIRWVTGTTEINTSTNQFDCTMRCGISSFFPTIYEYLSPYFIIECKNEPEKKPNNTYCNKLLSILETNEAKLGIIFGRMDATSTCFTISREHYLASKNTNHKKVIVTFSDKDLDKLINDKVNLLKYLEFKIFQITSGSSSSTYEMFMSQNVIKCQ
ncbi:MAG: hypothetical protein UHN47_16030 [Lachnospiraceae bacterium]|nr:hypothetical protein [Lachnospiraceae bacterium]